MGSQCFIKGEALFEDLLHIGDPIHHSEAGCVLCAIVAVFLFLPLSLFHLQIITRQSASVFGLQRVLNMWLDLLHLLPQTWGCMQFCDPFSWQGFYSFSTASQQSSVIIPADGCVQNFKNKNMNDSRLMNWKWGEGTSVAGGIPVGGHNGSKLNQQSVLMLTSQCLVKLIFKDRGHPQLQMPEEQRMYPRCNRGMDDEWSSCH